MVCGYAFFSVQLSCVVNGHIPDTIFIRKVSQHTIVKLHLK